MQAYFRRAPEVLHLRVGYGLPERDGGADASASAPAVDGPRSAGRAWVAVAELEWSAADDAGAALRKLRQLQASICADQPKACPLAPGRAPPAPRLTRPRRPRPQDEEVVAELAVVGGAEARSGRAHEEDDGDSAQNAAAAAQPAVLLRLSVRVPQVTALKMELSRVTGSAGSPLVRGGATCDRRSAPCAATPPRTSADAPRASAAEPLSGGGGGRRLRARGASHHSAALRPICLCAPRWALRTAG